VRRTEPSHLGDESHIVLNGRDKLHQKLMPRPPLTERTFDFAVRVVRLCRHASRSSGMTRPLATQLLRSATSIGANVEEAQASQSRADFLAKYSIACKEARETRYWLRLLAACEIAPRAEVDPLGDEANQLIAILTASVRKLRARTHPSVRHEE
jgi:four helix bundle protein